MIFCEAKQGSQQKNLVCIFSLSYICDERLRKNMAITKKEEFSDEERRFAELAKALSHPARIAILRILAEQKSCICGEIVEVLPLAQATVSQHLKELKNVGLVQGTIDGPRSCYCLNPNVVKEITNMMGILHEFLIQNNSQNCC